jgi:hypothetical protein
MIEWLVSIDVSKTSSYIVMSSLNILSWQFQQRLHTTTKQTLVSTAHFQASLQFTHQHFLISKHQITV